MNSTAQFIVCPRRPGSPRVAEAVCRACQRARRCTAWRDHRCPSLFPDLSPARPLGRA